MVLERIGSASAILPPNASVSQDSLNKQQPGVGVHQSMRKSPYFQKTLAYVTGALWIHPFPNAAASFGECYQALLSSPYPTMANPRSLWVGDEFLPAHSPMPSYCSVVESLRRPRSLSSGQQPKPEKGNPAQLCDGCHSVWLRLRYDQGEGFQ